MASSAKTNCTRRAGQEVRVKAVGTVVNRPDAIQKTKAAPKVLAGQEVLAVDRTMNVAVPVAAVPGATAPLAARGRTDRVAPVGVDRAPDDGAAVVRPDRRLLTESWLTR
jgi:hypothetical protein